MSEAIKEKRDAGIITANQDWLVLTESQGQEGVGYVHSCGEEIRCVTVKSPVWDGPGPCSGSKNVEYQVPYCPNCEKEPGRYGLPIF